jgi:hypothetical protein
LADIYGKDLGEKPSKVEALSRAIYYFDLFREWTSSYIKKPNNHFQNMILALWTYMIGASLVKDGNVEIANIESNKVVTVEDARVRIDQSSENLVLESSSEPSTEILQRKDFDVDSELPYYPSYYMRIAGKIAVNVQADVDSIDRDSFIKYIKPYAFLLFNPIDEPFLALPRNIVSNISYEIDQASSFLDIYDLEDDVTETIFEVFFTETENSTVDLEYFYDGWSY